MLSGSLAGGVGGEYNGVGLVEMSEIFLTQGDFFYSVALFNRDLVSFIPDNADKRHLNVITGRVRVTLMTLMSVKCCTGG